MLVAAGASTRVLRPNIFQNSWGRNLAVSPGDHTIVAILDGTPRAWPSATITGIVAPRGTRVVGAWLMSAAQANAELLKRPGPGPVQSTDTSWRQVIDFPNVGPRTALPKRVKTGQDVQLAVVWKIEDCAAVTGPGGGAQNVPMVRWRTVLGTTYTSVASKDLGPTGTDAVGLLRSAGVCP